MNESIRPCPGDGTGQVELLEKMDHSQPLVRSMLADSKADAVVGRSMPQDLQIVLLATTSHLAT